VSHKPKRGDDPVSECPSGATAVAETPPPVDPPAAAPAEPPADPIATLSARLATLTAEIADKTARVPVIKARLADPADHRAAERELTELHADLEFQQRERTKVEHQLERMRAVERDRARRPDVEASRRLATVELPAAIAVLEASAAAHGQALETAISVVHALGAALERAGSPRAGEVGQPSLEAVRAGAAARIELIFPTFGTVYAVAPAMMHGNHVLSRAAYGRLLAELQRLVEDETGGSDGDA